MSQQQENGAPPRPPSNSLSEHSSYPSPPMQPSYAYPPPQPPAASEPYRQSPTASNMPILPPIRGIDAQSQPPAQPPPPQGAQHLPPAQPMPGYPYGPSPAQPMIPAQVGPYPPQRYPLPAQNADARMLSGGRHKKEIKRRTKTGCLTCRKRRIKVSAIAAQSNLYSFFSRLPPARKLRGGCAQRLGQDMSRVQKLAQAKRTTEPPTFLSAHAHPHTYTPPSIHHHNFFPSALRFHDPENDQC